MNTVFVGGSRQISRLTAQVKARLDKVIHNGHRVIIGDANGVDKAVQKHLREAAYDKVTVFCSGDHPRNNIGEWHTHRVTPPKKAKGFQFHAAKDREMARNADFGLMIWDSKSAGTVLNVLRLVRAGKKAVLINVPNESVLTIKTEGNWDEFISQCSPALRADLEERATSDEWQPSSVVPHPSLFETQDSASPALTTEMAHAVSEEELAASINEALASGDPASFLDALGNMARARGMTQVAKEAGLARESLYRSLGTGGNPEFATVLKVITAVGLRLEASKPRHEVV